MQGRASEKETEVESKAEAVVLKTATVLTPWTSNDIMYNSTPRTISVSSGYRLPRR